MLGLVLVIEDEVDLATTLEYNLKTEGFAVRVAHTGKVSDSSWTSSLGLFQKREKVADNVSGVRAHEGA